MAMQKAKTVVKRNERDSNNNAREDRLGSGKPGLLLPNDGSDGAEEGDGGLGVPALLSFDSVRALRCRRCTDGGRKPSVAKAPLKSIRPIPILTIRTGSGTGQDGDTWGFPHRGAQGEAGSLMACS